MCDGIAIIRPGSHYVRMACKLKNTERIERTQLPFAAGAALAVKHGHNAQNADFAKFDERLEDEAARAAMALVAIVDFPLHVGPAGPKLHIWAS